MKHILVTLFTILCTFFLIWSHINWNNKTTISSPALASSKPIEKEGSTTPEVDDRKQKDEILQYTKNWPDSAVKVLKKKLDDKKPFLIEFVGSQSIGSKEGGGWAYITETKLIETFGANIQVSVHSYSSTSKEFINQKKYDELVNEKPDMVIFEPFILNDNGLIKVSDSLSNITTFEEKLKESNPDVSLILQPSHPLFKAKYYPLQVEALKNYAKEKDIPYLDHWSAWPDANSPELKNYLEKSTPNSKGHELWAKFITDYLISK